MLSRHAFHRRAAILAIASRVGGSVATQRKRPRAYSSPACYLHELRPAPKVAQRGDVQIKRIYDEPDAADGFRALVDRLWPRGISKQRAALDEWLVDVAPSSALRKWFHRDPTRRGGHCQPSGLGAALSGCMVAPVGVPARAYVGGGVASPAPVVVLHGGYYYRLVTLADRC
jgi:hypothetical protein